MPSIVAFFLACARPGQGLFRRRGPGFLRVLIPVVLATVGWPPARAQAPQLLPETLFVVGTPATDSQGRSWAYLLWVGTDQELSLGRTYAVYAKAGDPATPGTYELRAVTGLQTEPMVIQALLNRSLSLGEDLARLGERIDHLFAALQPPAGSLAEKVSAVIRGSLEDPANFNNLVLLGRLHPGLNLCLGYAHAEPLGPGRTTFEIRAHDKALGRDLGVVGRVTVEAGAPVPLPAPGPVVQVPEASAMGDLNIKLRWATSADLRRLTLLNHGFNVFRVARAPAEAWGFHVTPPEGAALAALAFSDPAVKRVHDLPVLKTADYTAATVGDFVADPSTAFVADDNGRYREGGVALRNGDQYYYFVTSRDVLGRDWRASPGVLVTVCDRVAPEAPRGVQVFNEYAFGGGSATQALKVQWLQSTNTEDRVVNYYVYRWAAPADVQKFAGTPALNRIGGPIAHVAGQKFGTYLDTGAGAPQAPADYGRTYWYTVRAADDGACDGGNLSANSAPAFGVLRDRTGPAGPSGGIDVICCVPTVKGGDSRDLPDDQRQDETRSYYRFVCQRERPEIEWAEFYLRAPGVASNSIVRAYFERDARELRVDWSTPVNTVSEGVIPFYCRVGTDAGETSEYAVVNTVRAPKFTTVREVPFQAGYDCRRISRREAAASAGQKIRGCTGSHDPTPDGPGGGIVGPEIDIVLTPGTKEYRLYRRVDGGPLTLIKQAPADFDEASQVTITDPDMPANASVLCYYGQLFDEHGNASPLVLLDECIEVKLPTAVPLLSPIEAFGDTSAPKMRLRWFCPPYGVDRFEVSIANNLGVMAATISADLGASTTNRLKQFTVNGTVQTNLFYLYRTPHVGVGFGNGASFEALVEVTLGVTYQVMVAAVGTDGSVNQDSNAEAFQWAAPPAAVGPKVPWPARPLPDLNVFHSGLRAVRLPNAIFPGNAVRIATFERKYIDFKTVEPNQPTALRGQIDPASLLYTNRLGQDLFPVAVYRVQAPSTDFPNVSFDVLQVTPLMESIAHEFTLDGSIPITRIHDPFVRAAQNVEATNTVGDEGALYLLDTQPVIVGARYVYLMVRFAGNGEILEVIPSNLVEVTP